MRTFEPGAADSDADSAAPAPSDPLHSWLPAAIPASAKRFRVADARLAETLEYAGAEIVEQSPDVEIAAAGDLRGDADCAIVSFEAAQAEGGSRIARASRRLLGSSRARAESVYVRRRVRSRGYAETSTIAWDVEQVVRLPGVADSRRRLSPAELLPQRMLVVGHRPGTRRRTTLEAARAAASESVGTPLTHGWPLARAQTLVVVADEGVLRVAIGPGARGMERHRAALDALARGAPSRVVRDRVPWLVTRGTAGLAEWSLERRLGGRPAPPRLGDDLLADCVDFLIALHYAGDPDARPRAIEDDAAVVAEMLTVEEGRAVRALGAQLESDLASVPRGFGHGDFWSGNLLVEGGSLAGVVDWDVGGPDRLPLLDLLQLRLSDLRSQTREYFGDAVVHHLLPWARAGGDEVARAYARRTAITLDEKRLEALVYAFWLDYVAHELRKYGDRGQRPVWMYRNVTVVVDTLIRSHAGPARTLTA
jgi:hypothetical protein